MLIIIDHSGPLQRKQFSEDKDGNKILKMVKRNQNYSSFISLSLSPAHSFFLFDPAFAFSFHLTLFISLWFFLLLYFILSFTTSILICSPLSPFLLFLSPFFRLSTYFCLLRLSISSIPISLFPPTQ